MEQVTAQIRDFIQFITLQFIIHPQQAQLKVAEADNKQIRFRLVLHQDDVRFMIGRNGFTASSIRNIVKGAGMKANAQATLQIISHEEEAQRLAQLEAGKTPSEHVEYAEADETHDEELEG